MQAIESPLRPAASIRQATASYLDLVPTAPPETGPRGNLLLAALTAADLQSWSHQLERVDMPYGQALCESERSFLYFPTSAIVSMHHLTADGACAEVASAGNDGVIGWPLLMGGNWSNHRAVVQSAGHGYRVASRVVLDEFNRDGAFRRVMLRYILALLTQVAQTAACNRHHSVDQQVCRQILLIMDRVQGSHLRMTHELLAAKLGVRRESVTTVALALQRAGLIRYARGRIEVLDRVRLESRACECYEVVKHECGRLLPMAPIRPAHRFGTTHRHAQNA